MFNCKGACPKPILSPPVTIIYILATSSGQFRSHFERHNSCLEGARYICQGGVCIRALAAGEALMRGNGDHEAFDLLLRLCRSTSGYFWAWPRAGWTDPPNARLWRNHVEQLYGV